MPFGHPWPIHTSDLTENCFWGTLLYITIYIQVKKSKASELAKLSIMLRKAQMQVASLEKEKEQREAENAKLSKICDDLISKLD